MNADIALIQQIVENHINQFIAAHRGRVVVEDVVDGIVYMSMEGGCQGCAMAKRTMRDFVFKVIKEHVPCITDVQDVTDHSKGTNPYFKKST